MAQALLEGQVPVATVAVAAGRVRVRVCTTYGCGFWCDDPIPNYQPDYEWPDAWTDHLRDHRNSGSERYPGHVFKWRPDFKTQLGPAEDDLG